jgi:hypothetical protein
MFAWLVNRYVHSIPQEYLRRYLETTRKALSSKASRPEREVKRMQEVTTSMAN